MTTISVETLSTWLEEGRPVFMLDVRPQAERNEWAIPGSIHIDVYDMLKAHNPQALASFVAPCDCPIVTICGVGKTSQIAAEQLTAQGLQVYSLEGGMKSWSIAWNTAESVAPESDVYVIQVRRTGKGCLSYIIGAGEEAYVIDASLDPQIYLDLAHQHGWQITCVFDTHIHADHLSRTRQLAAQSGAMLFLPSQQRVSFPFAAISDGEVHATPQIKLTALYTPGHTLESTCYLLGNRVLFTGDTLFTTSVGRPDLHADTRQAQVRAISLYQSLQKLLLLPSDILVFPGHSSTPLPFDGRPLVSTLGEINARIDLLHETQTHFVEALLQRLPSTPPNYEQIITLNEQGVLPEGDVIELEVGANRCAIA